MTDDHNDTTTADELEHLARSLAIDGSPMIEFSVAVGEGVDLTRDELTRFVVDTLTDPRSWVARGVGFRLVIQGRPRLLRTYADPRQQLGS